MPYDATRAHDGRYLPWSRASSTYLYGSETAEILYGTAGDDEIRGLGGGDTLIGGLGDDVYVLTGRADVVIEAPAEGVDTISAAKDYVLPDHVENLNLWGWFTYGRGNALDNVLIGYDGAQLLNGVGGDDVLTGGGGRDVFEFSSAPGRDVVTDFVPGEDVVRLDSLVGFYSFAQVQAAMTQVGEDVVLALSPVQSVTFRRHQVWDFSADDFQLALDRRGLVPTFAEEFDGFSRRVDWQGPGVWNTTFGPGWAYDTRTLPHNAERQYYLDPEYAGLGVNPFSLGDGLLTITAAPSSQAVLDATGHAYTSGLINTRGTFSQGYGYFEIRAELPGAAGLWPAFWLLPDHGGWPPELDVMEMLGASSLLHTASHSQAAGWRTSSFEGHVVGPGEGFHTYGVLWSPAELVWYRDGVELHRSPTPSDMHSPMYLLANLAVGGWLAGDPNGSTPFPAEMKIDYVRAYAFAISTRPSDGDDVLIGTPGPDPLAGQAGQDRIDGGAGDDAIDGGPGRDTFVFGWESGRDVIYNFNLADDILDFSQRRGLGHAPSVAQVGADVVFSFPNGDSVTLAYTNLQALAQLDPWRWS